MPKSADLLKAIKGGDLPLWRKRRVFLRVEDGIAGLDAELAVLTSTTRRDSREDRRASTRRKLRTGQAVARRLARRPQLEGFIRKVLGAVLHRAQQRGLFGLEGDGPVIPTVSVSKGAVAGATRRANPMSLKERKERIAEIKRERADLVRQQRALQAADRDSETPGDPTRHRSIVLGGAFLSLARGRQSVARWLRILLDHYLTAKRDRALFSLESGPLVVGGSTGPRTSRQRRARASAAKPMMRVGDPGPEAVRRVTDGRTPDGSRAPAGGGSQAAGAGPDRAGHATAGDEPIWRPCRLRGAPTSAAAGTGQDWGARLDGVHAVAGLPEDLVDTMITIETSAGKRWKARVTEVVRRDKDCVVVRRDGAPRNGG